MKHRLKKNNFTKITEFLIKSLRVVLFWNKKWSDILISKTIIIFYCYCKKPTNVILEFKNQETQSKIENCTISSIYWFNRDEVTMMFDYHDKNWQNPLGGTKDMGNPKLKTMSKEKFNETFKIISYTVQERSRLIMNVIDKFKLHMWECKGKEKRFHHYQ